MSLVRNCIDGRLFQVPGLRDRCRREIGFQSTVDHRPARQLVEVNRSHPFHL